MSTTVERNQQVGLSRREELNGTSWLDTLRWMPREFRDWIASDGMRIEERNDENGMTVLAEIPGVDPMSDINVQVADGALSITARREEVKEEKKNGQRRTEFHYGDFFRRIPLPASAKVDAVSASYDQGILTVTIPCDPQSESNGKVIPIQIGNSEGGELSSGS